MDHYIVIYLAGIIILIALWFKVTGVFLKKQQAPRKVKRVIVYKDRPAPPVINKDMTMDQAPLPIHMDEVIGVVKLDSGKPMPLISIPLLAVDVSQIEKHTPLSIKDLETS